TDGAYTVPQQGTLALNGRDAKILTAGYDLDSQRLVYSTSEIMTHGPIGDRDLALLHGRTGEDGETVLRYPRQPRVTGLAGSGAATWDDVRGDLRLNYAHDGLAEVLVSDGGARPLLLLLADEATAARFWRQDTAAGMVLELGPALVRSASVRGPAEASGGSRLDLAGDTTAPSAVEVWAPPSVEAVTWNGHPLPTSVTASGSRLGQLPGPAAVALPVLTGWRYQAEAPERLPAFDDSGWTPADHATTNNPTKPPAGQPVLYADDYGFHPGDVWYRGRFASADAPTAVALTSTTGTQGIVQAWLNGGFLGSAGSGS